MKGQTAWSRIVSLLAVHRKDIHHIFICSRMRSATLPNSQASEPFLSHLAEEWTPDQLLGEQEVALASVHGRPLGTSIAYWWINHVAPRQNLSRTGM
jgi:hypothetical protein